jgi:hypothetical protein
MKNEQDETRDEGLLNLPESFNSILPRTIFAEADPERLDRKGQTFTGIQGLAGVMGQIPTVGAGSNILRNPSRRFYDPEITTTSIYLPRTIKQKNRWNRWFYDHDELIGVVLDTHAELPYSKAELVLAEEDPYIQQELEDCVHATNFFSMLPIIDLEFMKVGEVFIHTPWDAAKGRWSHIIIHNPDFVEVKFTPFADQECVIELIPDDELKSIVHSTKPENQQLKKRIPEQIFRRVLTGKNITLDPDEVTHIARRSNSYDIRGTSIISRLFRTLMYEDKLREAQITISDNFIYPLKIFKLGDPKKGWIPNETHQRALAQMLQQATFDPNFSLIYHYGLSVEYVTVADKVMKLDKEWTEISERKMIALGIGKSFLAGESTMACFTEGMEVTTPSGIKNIEDITKEDKIIDKEGKEQKVVDNWCEGSPEKITKIKLWGGKELTCTSNHKWPVWAWPRECACGCGKVIKAGKAYAHGIGRSKTYLKKVCCDRATINAKKSPGIPINYNSIQELLAKDIKKWDYMMIPRKFNEIQTDVTPDKARLLGYFLAEGNYSKHCKTKEVTGINLTFSVKERDTLVKEAKELCEKIGMPIIQIEEKTNSLRLRSANREEFKDIVLWFKKNAGEYFHGKKLSEEAMRWSLDLKKELIKGVFRGDGCQHVRSQCYSFNTFPQYLVSYTTTSKVLAYQIELILAQLGFPVNWTILDNSLRNRKTSYVLTIYGKFAYDLAKLVWGENSKIKFDSTKKYYGQKAWVDDNYVYIMVKDVKEVKNTKKVYNLTIENTHSYLAKNVGTYNSANVTLQMQMARYKAKRDLFETRWMRDKFFKVLAEKNEWYQRDKKELVGHYRVTRSAEEKKKRLIIPKILWHKKLMMRDDQAFLTFLNNVYAQGKGPLSAITLLQYMGLSLDEELDNKQKQRLLEEKIGALTHPSVGGPTGMGGGSVAAKIKDIFTKKKKGIVEDTDIIDSIIANAKIYDDSNNFDPNTKILIGNENPSLKVLKPTAFDEKEAEYIVATTKMLCPAEEKIWLANLNSPNIPSEVILQMFNLNNKLNILDKKHNGEFKEGVFKEKSDILKILTEIYKQGKLNAFGITEFFPIYKQYYATNEELTEYSDLLMQKEFESWVDSLLNVDIEKTALLKHIRNLGNSCFCYGQLKGFQEQGIYQVKIGNVLSTDGVRYGVKDLLSKGWNVGKIIAPKDEIILLYPCIEGFEEDEFHNNIDPHIIRQKSFTTAGIDVKNCPIEFAPVITRYLNKVGSFIKRKWDVLEFVKDVIDLDEWEELTLKDIQKKANLDIANVEDKKMRSTIEASLVTYERIKKRGSVPIFEYKRKLYISTWLGMEDRSLTDNLVRYINILDDGTEKIIKKGFKKANYDLSQQELETFSIFGHIEQLSKGAATWYIVKKDDADVDYRVRQGKMWDVKGKCLNNTEKDEVQIFKDNLRLWVDYPHFLDEDIRKSFEAL